MPAPGFEIGAMRAAVEVGSIEWQRHALERMMERRIRRAEVLEVLRSGERIEDYPGDVPYPSALFLGWAGKRPLHVVVAYGAARQAAYIITAYEPDPTHFEGDFRTRRTKP